MRVEAFGSGPLVIKLAGIVGGVGLYRESARAAADAGFRVALLDTAGDRRDDPAPGPVTWDLLVHEVDRGIDALGGEPAILWGVSFGCLAALAAAARLPGKVRGLLMTHPPVAECHPPLYGAAFRWCAGRLDPVETTRRMFALGFGALVFWELLAPPALVRIRPMMRSAAEAATPARTLRDKVHLLLETSPPLPEHHVPASIIAGPWDTVAPLSGARRLAGRLGATLRVIPWCGHSGEFSRPRAFQRVVVEELRRLDRSAG